MNKQNILALLACVLSVCATAQQYQQKRWNIGNKLINMETATPTVEQTITGSSVGQVNVICDSKEMVLFYVNHRTIYDKYGNAITGGALYTPDPNLYTTEVSIVPFLEANPCVKRYYVFYQFKDPTTASYFLTAKIVSCNLADGLITATDLMSGSNKRIIRECQFSNNMVMMGLAVTRSNFNGIRFLYTVGNGGVASTPISPPSGSDMGIGATTVICNHYAFEYNTFEVDLSNDERKLVWGTTMRGFNSPNTSSFFIIGLDYAGNWDGSTDDFSIQKSSSGGGVRGVEFNYYDNKIYFTTGSNTYADDGIYVYSFADKKTNYIPGSKAYGKSQLELATNGYIYASSATDMIGIDQFASSLSTALVTASKVAITGQTDLDACSYVLPDQIDGESYDYIPYYGHNYDDPQTLFFYDRTNYTAPATNTTWTPSNNPINSNGKKLAINGYLKFPPGNYELRYMDIYFGPNAYLEINSGTTVTLHCTALRGTGCGGLWQGVKVLGTGKLVTTPDWNYNPAPSVFGETKISDAITGVHASGTNAEVTITGGLFDRNQTHVKLQDYVTKKTNTLENDIDVCRFIHNEPLRNGSTTPTYGTTGVEITDGTNYQRPFIKLFGSIFSGGTYGVKSTAASVSIENCDFIGIQSWLGEAEPAAVYVDMESMTNSIKIDGGTYTNNYRAAYITDHAYVTIKNAEFIDHDFHTVTVENCGNRTIEILDNTFDDCPVSAIMLYNNASSKNPLTPTSVTVAGNTINNSHLFTIAGRFALDRPTGITIEELGLTSAESYFKLSVNNNSITNVGYGIKMTNIAGYNRQDGKFPGPPSQASNINNNPITYYTTWFKLPLKSDYNMGIELNRCMGTRTALNVINSNQNTKWRNAGIKSDYTTSALFFQNTIRTGRGISAVGNATGNDYLCNTFNSNVNGISFGDHWMRTPGDIHGIKTVEARDNAYNSSFDKDVELYLASSKRDQATINRYITYNQWLMSGTPSVLIDPDPNTFSNPPTTNPLLGYLKPASAPDICTDLPLYDDGKGHDLVKPDTALSVDTPYYWNMQYNYERQLKKNNEVDNSFLSKLIDLEEFIATSDDVSANSLINTMSSFHPYENNFLMVYKIVLDQRASGNQPLSASQKAKIEAIASQTAHTGGPAVFTARAMMWRLYGENYVDMTADKAAGIGVNVMFQPCYQSLPQGFQLQLKDDLGTVYDFTITVNAGGLGYLSADDVATLPTDRTYKFTTTTNHIEPPFLTLDELLEAENNYLYLCSMGKTGNALIDEQEGNNSNDAAQVNGGIQGIKVYPNPANQYLKVEMPEGATYNIAMYNLVGQKVYQQTGSQGITIGTSDFEGIYLMKITDQKTNVQKTIRVLITR